MRRTESTSKVLKMTVLTSTDTINTGKVVFTVIQETNTYEDGSVKKEMVYTKQDSRRYTDSGRFFQMYKSSQGMVKAAKRLINTGEFTVETRNYI